MTTRLGSWPMVGEADYQAPDSQGDGEAVPRCPEDEYPSLPQRGQEADQVGTRSSVGKDKTIRKADRRQGGDDHRDVPQEFQRLRLRPADSQASGQKTDQIFIPVDAGRDASTGDEVLVKVEKKSKGAGFNPEGRIVQVVSRGRRASSSATTSRRSASGYVQVDGSTFSAPLYGRRPGRQRGPPRRQGGRSRSPATPRPYREGEGVITEVFGPRGRGQGRDRSPSSDRWGSPTSSTTTRSTRPEGWPRRSTRT